MTLHAPAGQAAHRARRERPEKIERLQLSLRPAAGVRVEPGSYGVEIWPVTLGFEPVRKRAP